MNKILLVVFYCLFLCRCSTKIDSQSKSEKVFFNPQVYFVAIEKARKNKIGSIAAIDSIYSKELSSFVKSVDSTSDVVIMNAIKKGQKNEAIHVQSQIISKTIQKVFFNETVRLLGILQNESNEFIYNKTVKNIIKYYSILSPTVIRRSEWVGKKREFEETCRMQLEQIKTSFKNQGVDKKASMLGDILKDVHILSIENTLVEVYLLSVFYELDGIAKNRGKSAETCEEKVAEGRIFFEIVKKYAKDTTLVNDITSSFEINYNEMDIEKIKKLISKAFLYEIPEVIR